MSFSHLGRVPQGDDSGVLAAPHCDPVK